MLDRTEQRIVGVLIEKEATVPDTYPMSENALVAGCNQKNNRDPLMELQSFEVAGALRSLMEKGWVGRLDGGSRVTKFRHKVVEHLGVRPDEVAILCELLVRGPQAPGALKPRLSRLGYNAEPAAIEDVLRRMAGRPQPLVEQLPLGPRERDRRWGHLLGPREAQANDGDGVSKLRPLPGRVEAAPAVAAGVAAGSVPAPAPAPAPAAGGTAALEDRVAALEQQITELQAQMQAMLRGRSAVDG